MRKLYPVHNYPTQYQGSYGSIEIYCDGCRPWTVCTTGRRTGLDMADPPHPVYELHSWHHRELDGQRVVLTEDGLVPREEARG